MIKKYRKNPVVIKAVEWNGRNSGEIKKFIGKRIDRTGNSLIIPTLEGDMEARLYDFVVRGVSGEFYPCKPDIFIQTYEEAEE